MRRRRRGRLLNGILVLDKPPGRTSNAVLQQVKALYFAAKAGHTGSLDPLATGVLPLCFGEATKFSGFLLESDKCYAATVSLGANTNTGDSDGEVLTRADAGQIDEAAVEAVLPRFRGKIKQVPPMVSALKYHGRPLYELAREGVEVEREPREINIYELQLLAFRPGRTAEIDLAIRCSKGTYVRTIAEDIGAVLGSGGHVTRLHRSNVGPFSDIDAVSLDRLEAMRQQSSFSELDALLQPVSTAVGQFPSIELTESSAFYLRQGRAVSTPGLPDAGLVALNETGGGFLGVGEVLDDGRVTPRRLLN